MIVLLIAATVLGIAGLLGLGFGLPIKDTTFGNTIQLAGVTLLCTAMILLGLAMVVRELKAIGRSLAEGAGRAVQRGEQPAVSPSLQRPSAASTPFAAPTLPAEPPAASDTEPERGPPTSPPPWAAEAAVRDRTRGPGQADLPPVEGPPPPETAAPERPARRGLLFSTRRRDRPAGAAGDSDPDAMEVGPAALPPMAPPVLPPMSALEAEPRAFESAWPARRQPPTLPQTPASPGPSAFDAPAETTAATHPPAGVTVIKSGVVDGMAYSLYSDGSIEAQMPEGMLRFASLDELRSHLDSRP